MGGISVAQILDTVNLLYLLRPCDKKLSAGKTEKPCLNYHIKRCLAPCAGLVSEEEYAARHFGVRCPEFLRSIGIDDPAEIDRLRRRKIELYPRYFDLVTLNRPLWEFCQQFRAQGGRVWIVSTGQRANIDNVMRHLHLEAGVDGIISALDAPQSKPDPGCFLKAMEIEGATPDETLIFEDSAVGIEAARRSGAAYFVVKL